MKNV
jgi:hypothetical protein